MHRSIAYQFLTPRARHGVVWRCVAIGETTFTQSGLIGLELPGTLKKMGLSTCEDCESLHVVRFGSIRLDSARFGSIRLGSRRDCVGSPIASSMAALRCVG
jgi:hypothetical protein